ncbi:hypothetical protein D3C78_549090 [compost metagenome]
MVAQGFLERRMFMLLALGDGFAERRGFFHAPAQVQADQPQRRGDQERDAPAPGIHRLGRQAGFQAIGDHCRAGKGGKGRHRHEAAIEGALVVGRMLHQVGAGPGILATGGKALQAAREGQQRGGCQADAGVGRQQADEGRGAGHQQDGQRQDALAPQAVTQRAEHDAAQRAQGERHGEHRKGLEQGHAGVFAGEELAGDQGSEKAVDGEVEPFDEIADGRGGDHPAQGGGGYLVRCGHASALRFHWQA